MENINTKLLEQFQKFNRNIVGRGHLNSYTDTQIHDRLDTSILKGGVKEVLLTRDFCMCYA